MNFINLKSFIKNRELSSRTERNTFRLSRAIPASSEQVFTKS